MAANDLDDIAARAGHAFWQAGLASLPATVPLTEDALKSTLYAFAVAGVAAALSAVKGMVKARRRVR